MNLQRIAAFLRSVRFTLLLLFALALLAGFGTVRGDAEVAREAARTGFDLQRLFGLRRTFSSPAFLTAIFLLTLNIVLCTLHRCRGAGWKRRAVTPDVLLHLSIVMVIAGGTGKVIHGVVRTVVVSVGTETGTVFDWTARADVPLGFTLRVERFLTEHYPFRARVGLSEPGTGRKIGIVEVVEGRPEGASVAGVKVALLGIDRERRQVDLSVTTPSSSGRVSLGLTAGLRASAQTGGVVCALVAYRDEEKGVKARLRAVRENGLASEQWLSPGGSLEVDGTQIFLTAWGRDEFGNQFAGFQVARDPAAPLFWAGCILLACALPLHVVGKLRRRAGAG